MCLLLILLVAAGCHPRLTRPGIKLPGGGKALALGPEGRWLAGRRICLDPGHGGPWPGAVASSNGIRESDVNLRVALALRDILVDAGAEVIMTRESDQAVDPQSLDHDLEARAQMANRAGADAFVSIHHNAALHKQSRTNHLEVYYKLQEEGPSLDLAQKLTHALATDLRADATAKFLRPGNYHVLRCATIPAVLVESSYLTNPRNAAFLSTTEASDAEALAIAHGLAAYFALDPPRVDRAMIGSADGGRTHHVTLQFSRGLPLDPYSISATLNDRPVDGERILAGQGLVWAFTDVLANGIHKATIEGRNSRGAAFTYTLDLPVARPAAAIHVTQRPENPAPDAPVELLFEAHVTDSLGMGVADGTPVLLEELHITQPTSHSIAHFYLPPGVLSHRALTFKSGSVDCTFLPRTGQDRFRSIRTVDAATGKPVGRVTVSSGESCLGVTTDAGWFCLPAQVQSITTVRAGYEPQTVTLTESPANIPVHPVAAGALHAKRIVLDPTHGGWDAGGIGPTGMRACDVSLDVALRTAAHLREAGACVLLTRTGDVPPSELERVIFAESEKADIYVALSFGGRAARDSLIRTGGRRASRPDAFIGHYPSSKNGALLAKSLAAQLENTPTAPCVAYVIVQTGCPAVLVQPASVTTAKVEDLYRSQETRAAAAQALFQGLLAYYQANPLQ